MTKKRPGYRARHKPAASPIRRKVVIGNATLYLGDASEVLASLPARCMHVCITDPPYGLSDHGLKDVVACLSAWASGKPFAKSGKAGGFMNVSWDKWVPGPEVWREVNRVLRPGSPMLSFAGTRSMDLMSMAVRLAGFDLRDSIGFANDGGGSQAPLLAWVNGQGFPKGQNLGMMIDKAAKGHPQGGPKPQAQTAEGKKWNDWNSQLKPAWEPILVFRKPLEKNLVTNVLKYGTGALNIGACRINLPEDDKLQAGVKRDGKKRKLATGEAETNWGFKAVDRAPGIGRYPANVVHDGSPAVLAGFPAKAGASAPVKGTEPSKSSKNAYGKRDRVSGGDTFRGDSGSAARFFYCAKASPKDRGKGNTHATVKPRALMDWLVKLTAAEGVTILDPFMGSGSTGLAVVASGRKFVGIEMNEEYFNIAIERFRRQEEELCAKKASSKPIASRSIPRTRVGRTHRPSARPEVQPNH